MLEFTMRLLKLLMILLSLTGFARADDRFIVPSLWPVVCQTSFFKTTAITASLQRLDRLFYGRTANVVTNDSEPHSAVWVEQRRLDGDEKQHLFVVLVGDDGMRITVSSPEAFGIAVNAIEKR